MTEPAVERHAASTRTVNLGSSGGLVIALVVAWAAALAIRPLNDNSFFTHLATGRLILSEGRVPAADRYTFTARGSPWTVQSWLASVVSAGAERLAGDVGLRCVVLGVFLCAAVAIWALTSPVSRLVPRVALLAVGLGVANGLWVERPYMVGILGMALLWLALDGRVPSWTVVPMLWVWGNSHGSFVYGPLLVSLVIAGSAFDHRRWRWHELPVRERRVASATALGVFVVGVGPLGVEAWAFPIRALRRSEAFAAVSEWQAPNFRSPSEICYLVLVAVAIVLFARSRTSWRLILPSAVFVAASLYSQRNIAMASVVLMGALAPLIPETGTLRATDRLPLGRAMTLAAAVVAGILASTALSTSVANFDGYPARPLAWMTAPGRPQGRLAAELTTGNLIEVLDGSHADVFMDDRVDMFPDAVREDYLTLHAGGRGWEAVLRRYGIRTVMWSADQPLAGILRSDVRWQIVYQDSAHLVARRR